MEDEEEETIAVLAVVAAVVLAEELKMLQGFIKEPAKGQYVSKQNS